MQTAVTETTTCLLDHDSTPELLFQHPDWWLDTSGDFAWNRCPECSLLFLSPRPTHETIANHYPEYYAAYRPAIADEPWAIMRWKRKRNLRHQIHSVTQIKSGGHLLDVGCATGNYLAEMRQLGWQVSGVEIQPEAAEYARRRFGLNVLTGDLLSNDFPDNTFDVLTMWDVLEHTHNPLAILKEAKRLLKPDGITIFSIPDVDKSIWCRRFGAAWIGYDSPRHLYLFPDRSLRLILQQAELTLWKREHTLATYHTWVASFNTWLNYRWPKSAWRSILLKIAYLPIWPTVTTPYFSLLNRRNKGTVVTVYARPAT